MANEIDFSGKLVQYGGPTITLRNDPLGSEVERIYSKEATGWKLFTRGVADFLNSKKVLNDGDIVLVVPMNVPMDFPIKTGGVPVETKELTLLFEAGFQIAETKIDALHVGRFQQGTINGVTNIVYRVNRQIVTLPYTFAQGDSFIVEAECAGSNPYITLIPILI